MICTNGHSNVEEARFCGVCGIALSPNTTSSTPQGSSDSAVVRDSDIVKILKSGLLRDLEKNRKQTAQTNLQTVLSFIAGSLMAIGIFLFASDVDSKSGAMTWAAVGMLGAYLFVKFLGEDIAPGAVVLFIPATALFVIGLFESSLSEYKYGLPLIVLGLIYLAAWALPLMRARQSLLVAAVVSFSSGLIALTAESQIACSSESWSCDSSYLDNLSSSVQKSSILTLVIGLALLAGAWSLDRKNWPQLGRVFIGTGILFEVGGAYGIVVSGSDQVGGAILMFLAGVVLTVVAVQRDRKSSLVIGGIAIIGGVSALLNEMVSSDSPSSSAVLFVIVAAGFGFLAVKKAAVIQSKLGALGGKP